MVKKAGRNKEEDASDLPGAPARERQPRLTSNHRKTIFGGISMEEIISQLQPWMETSLREAVREEVIRAVYRDCNPSMGTLNLPGSSGICNLELRFVGVVPRSLYHGNPIETDDGTPLQIVLVDRTTSERVISGPLSSLKVEIVVLSSEFVSPDEREDWTADEFDRSVMREREGRRPLLTGETNVMLVGGVGALGTVMFTDNSSWTRNKTFQLGARVSRKMQTEMRVREAVSNPFSVKEHRGEKFKKHFPPFPDDEVWRLVQIRKDGPLHDRLHLHGIATVIDFLRQYEVDPSTLKSILGHGVSTRSWNTIVAHAKACVVDDGKFYTCNFMSESVVVFFDSVYRVAGATFGGHDFVALENFTVHQKEIVESLKTEAHAKRDEWLLVDAAAVRAANLQQDDPSYGSPIVHRGRYRVVPAPVLLPATSDYGTAGYTCEENWQSPTINQPFRVLNLGEAENVCQGGQGYDDGAALMECLLQGDDEHCQWHPGSSSCLAWADELTPLGGGGGGMNSNRSSLTSLDTLGSTSLPPNTDYKVFEQLPPRGSEDALF